MKSAIIAVLVAVLAGAAFVFKDEADAFLSGYLHSEEEEPVPAIKLEARSYSVLVPAEGELTGLEMTPIQAPRLSAGGPLKLAWVVPEGSVVEEGELLIRFDNTDAQTALEKNLNEVSSFGRRIDKSRTELEMEQEIFRMDRDGAELELDYARNQVREDEKIFSRQQIEESVVSAALAEFKKKTVEEKGAIREQVSQADLEILDIQKKNAESKVDNAREKLASLEIRAPSRGVVVHSRRGWSRIEEGAEIWPGSPILELAALYKFQGELQVLETEITGVKPGAPVEVEIPAFPERTFRGEVTSVGKAAQQASRDDPRKYFACKVLFKDVPLEVMRQLKSGMRIEGRIELARSEDALIVPKSAVIKEEDEFKVFVQRDGGKDGEFEERPVEIVESDHGFYVIEGVEAGRTIALRHPYRNQELTLPDFNAPARSSRRRFVF